MAITLGSPEHRARIISKMRRSRDEIRQMFTDAASWNDNSTARKNGAPPIDIDPDGSLRRILEGLEFSLAAEAAAPGLGRIEPVAGVPGARPDEREPQ